jgi:PIN domain nuclease of toxin-antitoxin system
LLLDTHVAVWAITEDARLSAEAQRLIEDSENDVLVSAISVFEIAVKHGLSRGRLSDMPFSGTVALEFFIAAGFALLPITAAHAAAVETLPRLHADPFDRLLLAQAITEPARLMTRDAKLLEYGSITISA